jgi:hypothetical protein
MFEGRQKEVFEAIAYKMWKLEPVPFSKIRKATPDDLRGFDEAERELNDAARRYIKVGMGRDKFEEALDKWGRCATSLRFTQTLLGGVK